MPNINRGFSLNTNRYRFDFGMCRNSLGWAQIDTWQDASYFGVWTNPFSREIFTYCEGDLTHTTCDDDDDYRAALSQCLEFYDRGGGSRTMIDPGGSWKTPGTQSHGIAERLNALGFGDRLH